MTLAPLTQQPYWDSSLRNISTTAVTHSPRVRLVYSEGDCRVTCAGDAADFTPLFACGSAEPTDCAVFRIASVAGNVAVGLGPAVADGAVLSGRCYTYTLWVGRCLARGPAGLGHGVYPPLSRGVVRCVRDRARGTIAFSVDGRDCGVAFYGVPGDVVLHAVAALGWSCDSVELL